MYLFRVVDSQGQTVDFYPSETRDREAAKLFLQRVCQGGVPSDLEPLRPFECLSTHSVLKRRDWIDPHVPSRRHVPR